MAFIYNKVGATNGIAYSNGCEFIFEMKEALKAQGWTVPRSGDGSTYNAAGDQITHAGTGAGGMQNTRAWFEIASPDAAHHFIFQFVFPTYAMRNKYSENAFSGGSPSANTVGSAVDEVTLCGSGTDASPGSASLFASTTSSRVLYIAVEDEAPYRFWAHGHIASSGLEDALVFLDQFVADSYDASDPWPFVAGCTYLPNEGTLFTSFTETWTQYGGTWVEASLAAPSGWGRNSAMVRAGGTDPISGADITFPGIWGRNPLETAPTGWRGVSSLFEVSLAPRNNGDTLSRDATRDRVYIAGGALSAAWNGEIPA